MHFLTTKERPYRFRRGVKLDEQLQNNPNESATGGPLDLVRDIQPRTTSRLVSNGKEANFNLRRGS